MTAPGAIASSPAGAGNDYVLRGSGNDILWGEAHDDFLAGEAGDDQLNGGVGADWIDGGTGRDVLRGDPVGDPGAADTLVGGAEADILYGGGGYVASLLTFFAPRGSGLTPPAQSGPARRPGRWPEGGRRGARPRAGRALAHPNHPQIRQTAGDTKGFADTAALIQILDLVIAVDTSVPHLAGGLGRPVWLLSGFDACWRWLWDRTDSPWYPTLRLFRQPRPGAWEPVLADVTAALAEWAGGQSEKRGERKLFCCDEPGDSPAIERTIRDPVDVRESGRSSTRTDRVAHDTL